MSKKSRTIGLDIIMAVEYKKALFWGEHKREPRYVVLPEWALKEMVDHTEGIFKEPQKKTETLCGLIPCPTREKTELSEIEVF